MVRVVGLTTSGIATDVGSPKQLVHAEPHQEDISVHQLRHEEKSGDDVSSEFGKQTHLMRSATKKTAARAAPSARESLHVGRSHMIDSNAFIEVLDRQEEKGSGTTMTAAREILSRGGTASLDGSLVHNSTWSVEPYGSVAQKGSQRNPPLNGASTTPALDSKRKPSKDDQGVTTLAPEEPAPEPAKLTLCQGDCDSDSDCVEPNKCFKRGFSEPVPGCTGDGKPDWDYCFAGTLDSSGGWDAMQKPLWKCAGDCDADEDCSGALTCFQRRSNEEVPGCQPTGGSAGMDYCIGEVSNGSQ